MSTADWFNRLSYAYCLDIWLHGDLALPFRVIWDKRDPFCVGRPWAYIIGL
jgi:hypothetical protein